MASVVNWGSSDYFRYYAGGWSSWSTAPATGGYLNRYGTGATNYKVLGSCTVTPSSGKKLTQFSVTTKVYNQSESATSVTWYCYLTTTTPFLQNGTYIAPTSRPSYSHSASVTAAPSANGTNIKFTFTGLNITSATNFYMIFEQSSDKYYSLGGGGFAYSAADMVEVSSSSVTFRPNGGTCTFNGTSYNADSPTLTLWQGQAYSIGTPSWSGHRFLGWTQYSGTVVFSKAHTTSGLSDPGFYSGQNNVVYYNNSGGSWTCSRVADSGTYRGYYGNYRLDITLPNVTSTPGHGGWRQNPGGFAANNTYAYMARAYIPTAQTLYIANNSLGSGGASSWYTRQTGAGAYVNYGYQLKLGTRPHGGAGFYTYLSGGSKPISIHINCATGYNITNGWSMNATPTSGSLVILGVWNYNNYTITYNANGGSSTPSSQTKYHDQALTLAAAISRSNSSNSNSFTVSYSANGGSSTPSSQTNTKYTSYAFSKWNTNSSGTGTNYAAGGSYTANAGATLYAKWTATTHQNSIKLAAAISHANGSATRTVTLNANGGSVSPTSKTSTATVTYSFEKWHSGSASGTAYAAGATYTPSANVKMYAGWTSSTGTFSAVTLPTPTRTGYTCSGWYTATSGGTKRADAGGSYTPPGNETLYAHWTANSYTITLNKNGGAGGTDSVSIAYNTAKGSYPSITKPTRTGYTFNGYWDTSAASGGTEWYDANGNSLRTFNLTANATWYARWTKIQSVVKYYPNGGTVAPQAGGTATTTTQNYSYEYGTNQTAPTPTRTGYTFLRWSRQMNGISEAINYGRSMMAATLRYRVYAYRSDWSNIGTERIISCTESGGWNIENNSGKITFAVYSQGDNAYRNANSTITWASLSAGWHCFEFVFNGTNAKGYLDGTLIATSANFTAPSGSSTGRISYHATNDLFLGDEATNTQNGHGGQYWSGKLGLFYVDGTTSGPIGPTTSTNAFRVYASTSGWTYSAEWQRNMYNITYALNGGTQAHAQNHTAVVADFTVVYNPTTASYDMTHLTLIDNKPVNAYMYFDNPTKTGYTFTHWTITGLQDGITHSYWANSQTNNFTGASADTSTWDDPKAVPIRYLRATAGTVTFTAHYNPHTYTVTFKTGNTTMGTQSFTYDSAQNLTAVADLTGAPVSGNGWTFYGWATTYNTTTRTYTDGQSVSNLTATDNGNVILYAIYSRTISGKYYNSATATTTSNLSLTQYYCNTNETAAGGTSITFPVIITQTANGKFAVKGWSNGTGTTTTIAATSGTAATGTPSITSSATYNALYDRTVTINYNGNNNTGGATTATTGTQYYNAGNSAATALNLTLAANGFTKAGYKFVNWAAGSVTGTQYAPGTSRPFPNTAWNSTATYTYYAIWEPYGIIRVPPSLTPSNITTNSNNSVIVDGLTFLLTIPYIYKNGSWQQHQPFGYDNGEWKVGE